MTERDAMSAPGPPGSVVTPRQDLSLSTAEQLGPMMQITINPVLGDKGPMPAAEENLSSPIGAQSLRPSLLGKRTLYSAELLVWCARNRQNTACRAHSIF